MVSCWISDEELEAYRSPPAYREEGGKVRQPGPDTPGPHMVFPTQVYKAILSRPDEEFLYSVEDEPPVKLAS